MVSGIQTCRSVLLPGRPRLRAKFLIVARMRAEAALENAQDPGTSKPQGPRGLLLADDVGLLSLVESTSCWIKTFW